MYSKFHIFDEHYEIGFYSIIASIREPFVYCIMNSGGRHLEDAYNLWATDPEGTIFGQKVGLGRMLGYTSNCMLRGPTKGINRSEYINKSY